ncbi:proline/glycine betaine ABC transporter ATP-binding protein [Gluconacetobacter johannae DSM 13595]|uniref:Trimethylamine N-oxide transport system ATP-binding protein TmoW n=1 Tax=Gluconacetobacter johannae TaxID=112140 RepID=A0A7W4J7X6_9PROT|nr:choline ABC transporter ATP-binding protein [Gluconacetobacter johannae]MBB2176304.1 choline ABC transporter ATP-binding protein [Gluconacetobacter johannae]GBQ90499.1 proline/glycine betaine ABC transporter ATP-binding protein [Gluconacetobacter johannae DSM 13595]
MTTALSFHHVDILFHRANAPGPLAEALRRLDGGGTREDIARDLGVTVGVADASLDIERGEISVLMGLSGSGKSTLLRAANGLNKVARGEVRIGNGLAHVDIARCDPDTLRELRKTRIAMVFQQFGLLPWRTVRDNVGFGLELRGMAPTLRRQVVDEKLELVGLTRWAEAHVGELSGGMQQRVGLARAFATDADILLMDEPFSALDPLIRRKLQDELLDLQRRLKKTILFVSHDIDEALKIGNRITIMREGRIVQTGRPDDIVIRPADEYVSAFVRHMNPLPVLNAGAVMRRLAHVARLADGRVALDAAGTCGLDPATQQVTRPDGAPVPVARFAEGDAATAPIRPGTIYRAPLTCTLQTIAILRQRSGLPVLIDDGDTLAGLCDDADMIGAMIGIPRAPVP